MPGSWMNTVLYRDSDHLSTRGALSRVGPLISKHYGAR